MCPSSPSDSWCGQLQGDGATHDHIRSMQLHIGVPKAIARALQQWGSSSDEVSFLYATPCYLLWTREMLRPFVSW